MLVGSRDYSAAVAAFGVERFRFRKFRRALDPSNPENRVQRWYGRITAVLGQVNVRPLPFIQGTSPESCSNRKPISCKACHVSKPPKWLHARSSTASDSAAQPELSSSFVTTTPGKRARDMTHSDTPCKHTICSRLPSSRCSRSLVGVAPVTLPAALAPRIRRSPMRISDKRSCKIIVSRVTARADHRPLRSARSSKFVRTRT